MLTRGMPGTAVYLGYSRRDAYSSGYSEESDSEENFCIFVKTILLITFKGLVSVKFFKVASEFQYVNLSLLAPPPPAQVISLAYAFAFHIIEEIETSQKSC